MPIPPEYWAFFIYETPDDDIGYGLFIEPGFGNENSHVKVAEKILSSMVVGTRGMLLNDREEIVWEGEVTFQDGDNFIVQGHFAKPGTVAH